MRARQTSARPRRAAYRPARSRTRSKAVRRRRHDAPARHARQKTKTRRRPQLKRAAAASWRIALLIREAIEQPVSARALQIVLAASAVRPARGMRGIPRQHRRRIVEALTVVVADRSEERRVGKECRSRWSPDH